MKLGALSLRQPWADLLFPPVDALPGEGPPKTIETRRWPRSLRAQAEALIGKRLAIHASKAVDAGDDEYVSDLLGYKVDSTKLPRGALVGTVLLLGTRFLSEDDEDDALCDCDGKFGLVFDDPRRLAEPIPYRGQLGFFSVNLPG